ncbi:MAG: acyl-CoA dehydrogenase [Acidimicrobiales bacterium]|jgi:alkylation response protein AidB-like acyl-CoA dehydrogenase|nr:acyl-CoA dehydrogenase [Acidimicrobiales bacterium]
MDFDLSDDQRALGDAAAGLLGGLASPEKVRAAMASGAGYDKALWQAMVDQGWLGVEIAEGDGGLGLGFVEVAVLAEQVGRHTAPAPFLPTVLALGALARAGGPVAERWVEPLLNGEAIGCVAFGTEAPVVAAPIADVAVVVDGDEVWAWAVGDGRPKAEPAMDQTQSLGWLTLDRQGATEIGGAAEASALLDRGAAALSAELLGGAARVLEMASEYAKERVQFGKPIGSFQAVKHRCADMLVDVEGMRSVAYYAAWAIGASHPDASLAASTAKTWCSDAAKRVMASGLQVHGGIGFTWEHDLHLFLKRSQLAQVGFGDAVFHRQRLARLLRPRVDAGESLF